MTEETTVEKRVTFKGFGSFVFNGAKWLYSIPGIKSAIATKVIQEVVKSSVGAGIIIAIVDKLLGA